MIMKTKKTETDNTAHWQDRDIIIKGKGEFGKGKRREEEKL